MKMTKELTKAIQVLEAKGYTVRSYDNYELGKLNEDCPVVYEINNADGDTLYGFGCCREEAVINFAKLRAESVSADTEHDEEIAELEEVIAKAERQEALPSEAEKAEWLREYNNAYNEGGEGYVPRVITRDQYDWARQRLAELKIQGGKKMNNYYDYKDLLAAATADGATQADIDALGEWFEAHGDRYWNGEYYDADGLRLYPVYTWDAELDQGTITGYEFR